MSSPAAAPVDVHLIIDGRSITVEKGTTIFDAARMNDIPIPILCHQHDETPVGVCRMCVVDVGERAYSAACIRKVEPKQEKEKARPDDPDLVIKTNTDGVRAVRKTVLELLMADHPTPCVRQRSHGDCELEKLAHEYGAARSPYPHRETSRGQDNSSHIILVDHSACILCDRCIRACAEVRKHFVIAREGKGYSAEIAFDMGEPMGSSSCVSCGECMISCPTGALTNKEIVDCEFENGIPCEVEELHKLRLFEHVSGTFLNFNRGAIVKRHIKQGEILFREGEGGATAFYLLEGHIDIFISTPQAHVHTGERSSALTSGMHSHLTTKYEHQREGEALDHRHIAVDAPRELSYDEPVAQIGPESLFGEMSCTNAYPRSATARAATDCVVLEMRRNVLDMLRKNKTFRSKVDKDYLEHTFENHLRKTAIFSSLTPEFVHELRQKVRLVRYAPGEPIFHQGDVAEAFYLVRRGFVKVSQAYAGGDLVLAYLPAGSHFGEIALLGHSKRTATCSALDHVDLVRISAEDFQNMLSLFPQVRAHIEAISEERLHENQQRFDHISAVPVDEFLRQGLMEAKSLLVLDLDNCTRCDQCVKACADAHDGVTRLVRDGLRLDHFLIATSCRHCKDPLCMVCPVGAIHRQKTLDVVIDDSCIGCGDCARNCPYGNINMHEFTRALRDDELALLGEGQVRGRRAVVKKATSCNLCEERKTPACVYACPHDAAHRVTGEEFGERLKR